MVELVDSVDLGSTAKSVQVRVLVPAPMQGGDFRKKVAALHYFFLFLPPHTAPVKAWQGRGMPLHAKTILREIYILPMMPL